MIFGFLQISANSQHQRLSDGFPPHDQPWREALHDHEWKHQHSCFLVSDQLIQAKHVVSCDSAALLLFVWPTSQMMVFPMSSTYPGRKLW